MVPRELRTRSRRKYDEMHDSGAEQCLIGTPSTHAQASHRSRRSRVVGFVCGVLVLAHVLYLFHSMTSHERPALVVRTLFQPIQWAFIGGYHHRGYHVVPIPAPLLAKLVLLVDEKRQNPDREFGGDGERLEDTIIFGRSSRIMIPNALRNELVDAFRPLVSSFCGCELQDDATVGSGGVRVYQRGAYLAHHLDWAHKFVVSATLNIRQANNGTRWPLTMQSFGLSATQHSLTHVEGTAVLYEGSRMLHGRPEPLEDEFYAAAFVGFVPKAYPEGRGPLTQLFVRAVAALSR